jgi:ABC-type multidrug transport system fused ATPase/permease subunit
MLKNGLNREAGIAIGIFFVMFAINFRLGAYLIDEGKKNCEHGTSIGAGNIMIAILVVFIAFNNMGTLIPSFTLISSARSSLYNIQNIIHAKSNLKQGDICRELEGNIEFINVGFSYPESSEKEVLINVSFRLNLGERLGVVGATGQGRVLSFSWY